MIVSIPGAFMPHHRPHPSWCVQPACARWSATRCSSRRQEEVLLEHLPCQHCTAHHLHLCNPRCCAQSRPCATVPMLCRCQIDPRPCANGVYAQTIPGARYAPSAWCRPAPPPAGSPRGVWQCSSKGVAPLGALEALLPGRLHPAAAAVETAEKDCWGRASLRALSPPPHWQPWPLFPGWSRPAALATTEEGVCIRVCIRVC